MILYHLLIIVIVSDGFTLWTYLRIPIIVIACFFLFYRKPNWEKWVMILYSLFFIGHLYGNYYSTANHYFLLSIFTWYVTYKVWFKDDQWNFPVYLLAVIYTAATLQKVISPYFLNGNLYGELFLYGDSTPYIGNIFFTDYSSYTEQFKDYYQIKYGNEMESVAVSDSIITWIKVITYIILAVELVVTGFLLFAKHYWKYFVFLLFILGTALLRFEYGFFSILLLISLFDLKLAGTKLHKYYLGAFIIMIIIHTLQQQDIFFGYS